MGDDLETRLKSHARAFEGLMSLIPAKDYYGKDESVTSTQWMKKKQSREERKAAKRAKLDPANHKSAKDIMDENARKRKRELEGGEDDSSDIDIDIEKEKPGEGMKAKKPKTNQHSEAEAQHKKQAQSDAEKVAKAKAKADRLKQKREKKKEQQAQKQQKQKAKKVPQEELSKGSTDSQTAEKEGGSEWEDDEEDGEPGERIENVDVNGLVEEAQSTATPSGTGSNASTTSVASASSASSIPPTTDAPESSKKTFPKPIAPKSHDEFRARLAAKLEAMRAARKAEGANGQPAKNRAELIEARRKKEAERKAARKAQRELAKEDEERVKAEDQLARIRGGSGSPSVFSHRSSPEQDRNFNFGRVAWKDGQQLESNLSGFLESKKRKGKSDPKTALEAAKNKMARLSALDEQKRKEIEEKDLWLDAKKRAQGERVHSDPKLLKKSVKRLEKGKLKSEKEWNERKTNIEKGKEAKQKRREANLKKRREEKGVKGKKKPGKKPAKAKSKRPGFEGSLKRK